MKPATPRVNKPTSVRKSTDTIPIKEAVYEPTFKYHPLNIKNTDYVNLPDAERRDHTNLLHTAHIL